MGGLGGYLLSSMLKLLICAIIVPETESFNIIAETLKESVSLIDLLMLGWVFTWRLTRATDKRTRALGVGLGWSAAELVCSHFLIFAINAGGGEFSWEYLQRAINANFTLFQGIALVSLVPGFYERNSFSRIVVVGLALAQVVFRPVLINVLLQMALLNSWTSILAQGGWTVLIFALTRVVCE
jgi:hypothetical protein